MNEKDYIRDYAIRNIWCTPDQDFQVRIKPQRIAPGYGVRNEINVGWERVELPIRGDVFNVYMIGRLNPALYNVFSKFRQWRDAVNVNRNLYLEMYNTQGVKIPNRRIFFRVLEDKSLIIAIHRPKINPVKVNYITDSFYLRVYSNAFLYSNKNSNIEIVRYYGKQIETTNDILALQNLIISLKAQNGSGDPILCYLNGRLVNNIAITNTILSDEVEIIEDKSIKKVYNFKLTDLREFNSILDNQSKYLLHPPIVKSYYDQIIEYYDDTELHIYQDKNNDIDGVRLHLNNGSTMRQVTHRDYSLSVGVVQAAHLSQTALSGWKPQDKCRIRLHVRHSGYDRPLVPEMNYVRELYRLDKPKIPKAMIGVDSHVNCWKAENLENSAYTNLMRHKGMNISNELISNALGYYGVSKLVANTPQKITNIQGSPGVWIPDALIKESTIYEFDQNGKYLIKDLHSNSDRRYNGHTDTKLFDVRKGYGELLIDDIYDEAVSDLDPKLDYRFYSCDIYNNNNPVHNWKDVTGSGEYFIQNDKVHWTNGPNKYNLVRSNKKHLAYEFTMDIFGGQPPPVGTIDYIDTYVRLFAFNIRQSSYQFGFISTHDMKIPLGELDIFLNGNHLIEGVDYVVKFPTVYIINTRHLNQPIKSKTQKFMVRFSGFCDSDLKRRPRREIGVIDHDLISRNEKFNIRENHLVQVSVGGKVKFPDDMKYEEFNDSPNHLSSMNGLPYQVSEILVPIKEYIHTDTYELRSRTLINTIQIEDYLTSKLKPPVLTTPNVIPDKWRINSPFITELIRDIQYGLFDNNTVLQGQFGTHEVNTLLQPYLWLLPLDPITWLVQEDEEYIEVVPHNSPYVVELPIRFYKFVEHAVQIHGRGLIQLSHYVSIKPI